MCHGIIRINNDLAPGCACVVCAYVLTNVVSMVHEADTTKVFDRAKLLTVMYA